MTISPDNSISGLLSVDVGLKTAFACFDAAGRVIWLQSRHFTSPAVLRKGIPSLLREMPPFSEVVLEGSGALTKIWQKELLLKEIPLNVVQAENWRRDLLYPREQRSGSIAKDVANPLATEILQWSGWKGTSSQGHDAAEAILCGFWFMLKNGCVPSVPKEIQNRLDVSGFTFT